MKRPVGVPETSSTGGVAAGEEGDTQRPLKKAHEGEAEATGSGRGQGDNGEAGAVPGGEAATGDAAPLLEGTSTREGTALGQPPVLVTGTAGSGVVAGKGTGERGKVRVRGAAAEDKGSRHTMEDTWLVLDDVAAAAEAEADWRQKGSQKAQSAALGFPFRCSSRIPSTRTRLLSGAWATARHVKVLQVLWTRQALLLLEAPYLRIAVDNFTRVLLLSPQARMSSGLQCLLDATLIPSCGSPCTGDPSPVA